MSELAANPSLEGTVAIVTGGSSGMGLATAVVLAGKGCRVVVASRDEARIHSAAERIRQRTGNQLVESAVCDVADADATRRLADSVLARAGRIDYLANFAGYAQDFSRIREARPSPEGLDDLEAVTNVDLLGTARMVFCVEPVMRSQGHGKILNIASTPVLDESANHLIYQVARAGVMSLSEVVARQHRADGVTGIGVFCLALGNVFNPSTYLGMSKAHRAAADAKRWLDPALHVAPVATWLLTGRLDRPSGSTTRLDARVAPGLFAEVHEPYTPFVPPSPDQRAP